jgi:hypothetical protein
MTYPSGVTTYIYGQVGWSGGEPTFTYDSDRLSLQQRDSTGPPASTDARLYEHDNRGNVTRVNAQFTFSVANPEGVTKTGGPDGQRTDVRYEYDAWNRLALVRRGSDSAEIASYAYHDDGVLKETTCRTQPSFKHQYVYNAARHLVRAVLLAGALQAAAFDYGPPDRPLALSGQRLALRQSGPGVPERFVDYHYDSLNRLVAEDIASDTGSPAIGTVQYAYDWVGNRLSRQSAAALQAKLPDFSLPGGTAYDSDSTELPL